MHTADTLNLGCLCSTLQPALLRKQLEANPALQGLAEDLVATPSAPVLRHARLHLGARPCTAGSQRGRAASRRRPPRLPRRRTAALAGDCQARLRPAGRVHGLRLPCERRRPAADRDQHQCRRRDAACSRRAGASRLLHAAGPHVRRAGRPGPDRRDLDRDVPRRMASAARRCAAARRRHRRRHARPAVPGARVRDRPPHVHRARDRCSGRGPGGTRVARRPALARGPARWPARGPGLQPADRLRPVRAPPCEPARRLRGRRSRRDPQSARARPARGQAQPRRVERRRVARLVGRNGRGPCAAARPLFPGPNP